MIGHRLRARSFRISETAGFELYSHHEIGGLRVAAICEESAALRRHPRALTKQHRFPGRTGSNARGRSTLARGRHLWLRAGLQGNREGASDLGGVVLKRVGLCLTLNGTPEPSRKTSHPIPHAARAEPMQNATQAPSPLVKERGAGFWFPTAAEERADLDGAKLRAARQVLGNGLSFERLPLRSMTEEGVISC